ncbi:MAG: NAD+ synthase [Myxococcota bacterium]|nr:NAD+ synthase [Myxococcota bacterium]MDW8361986.1 NAD+ synthase [Myxococcales bacterium]
MRIRLVQLNPTVGDLHGNAARIEQYAARACQDGVDLVVYPELVLTGYPPRDLLDRPGFVSRALETTAALAARLRGRTWVALGTIARAPETSSRGLHNAVVLVRDGRVEATIAKRLLPTYDVFDEDRWFEPGPGPSEPVSIEGVPVGWTVCEDVWNTVPSALTVRRYTADPVAELAGRGARLLVNVAASPFTRAKWTGRPGMLAAIAATHRIPMLFVNQVGGNDDLLFDGSSEAWDAQGRSVACAASFVEEVLDVEYEAALGALASSRRAERPTETAALVEALAMGIRDFVRKCGLSRVVLGVSGGIDSALVAALAARALGPENVLALSMPTRYSSPESVEDARVLCEALGVAWRLVPIDPIFQAHLDTLEPPLATAQAQSAEDATWENVQARIRAAVLMAFANRTGAMLLATGNKSELATGYCTLYGDMAGGLAPLGDVYKTEVYRLAREINLQAGRAVIPERTLRKAPSAELRPNQTDQDTLPPYDVLDDILARYVERAQTADAIVAAGHDLETVRRVIRMVVASEHKRRQTPPVLIVSGKAFGPGRRIPIARAGSD